MGKICHSIQRHRGELVTRPAIAMRGPFTAKDTSEHNRISRLGQHGGPGVDDRNRESAVERQSDLLNNVRLMDAEQEREEAVIMCVARLRGLANICALSMVCTKLGCTQQGNRSDRFDGTYIIR